MIRGKHRAERPDIFWSERPRSARGIRAQAQHFLVTHHFCGELFGRTHVPCDSDGGTDPVLHPFATALARSLVRAGVSF
jgi:hypothetical protein